MDIDSLDAHVAKHIFPQALDPLAVQVQGTASLGARPRALQEFIGIQGELANAGLASERAREMSTITALDAMCSVRHGEHSQDGERDRRFLAPPAQVSLSPCPQRPVGVVWRCVRVFVHVRARECSHAHVLVCVCARARRYGVFWKAKNKHQGAVRVFK